MKIIDNTQKKPIEYKIKTRHLFILGVALGVGILVPSVGLLGLSHKVNNLEKNLIELSTQIEEQDQILKEAEKVLEQYKQKLNEKQLYEQKDLSIKI